MISSSQLHNLCPCCFIPIFSTEAAPTILFPNRSEYLVRKRHYLPMALEVFVSLWRAASGSGENPEVSNDKNAEELIKLAPAHPVSLSTNSGSVPC